ncbi:MAG: hypothetical protein IBX45_11525 [Campylobacterales bacterium]|nr:hypothetical protein [Campylobacterales bacterium]
MSQKIREELQQVLENELENYSKILKLSTEPSIFDNHFKNYEYKYQAIINKKTK